MKEKENNKKHPALFAGLKNGGLKHLGVSPEEFKELEQDSTNKLSFALINKKKKA